MGTLEAYPRLNDAFFSVFGAWFDADLIDIRNRSELLSLAAICANDLRSKMQRPEGIADDVERMLSNWKSKDAMPFIRASNTDWLFDSQTEQLLRGILARMVKDLK